jgi:hypothetical protein
MFTTVASSRSLATRSFAACGFVAEYWWYHCRSGTECQDVAFRTFSILPRCISWRGGDYHHRNILHYFRHCASQQLRIYRMVSVWTRSRRYDVCMSPVSIPSPSPVTGANQQCPSALGASRGFKGCFHARAGAFTAGRSLEALAVRVVLAITLCLILCGCAKNDRFDRTAVDAYLRTQDARYRRYTDGNISEAKKAVQEMLDCANENRGKFGKQYYVIEWEVALAYGRLALIAEQENEQETAGRLWKASVVAQLKYQRDQRMWARSERHVRVPNQDSDSYTTVSADSIRSFLVAQQRDHPVAWIKTHEN